MISRDVTGIKSWIQASRHVNIAMPLVLGQVAAWHVTGRFSGLWFVAALLWGALDHLFVIFANDFADREADSGRRTMLSGGSGVIPDGKLLPGQIARAAGAAALLLLIYSCALVLAGRPWIPVYGLAALLLMWLYSFAPARLSYRGGGELLQGIGVGVGLPSLGYYMQAEGVFAPDWLIAPAALLGVCGNVLTALPDVDDDARAGKRTWPVRNGIQSARRFASAVGFGAGQSGRRRRSAIAAAGRREGRGSVPRRLVVERGGTSVAGALDGRDASETLAARAEQPSCLVANLVEPCRNLDSRQAGRRGATLRLARPLARQEAGRETTRHPPGEKMKTGFVHRRRPTSGTSRHRPRPGK
ncbi:MAG: prenyltransferase [Deltaproteobacteria bacterium]|nr:prenyltransferase [Deltaproteobacteria bacterium]